jgi:hypothetical protein
VLCSRTDPTSISCRMKAEIASPPGH